MAEVILARRVEGVFLAVTLLTILIVAFASIAMTAGVGLFATFTGFVASWCLEPREREQHVDLAILRDEVASLRSLLEERIR